MNLSIIVPAFNEAGVIEETLSAISGYFGTTGLEYEILVVDDGSTDSTRDFVAHFAASERAVRLLSLGNNMGKGAAVRRGAQEARGDVVAFIDADLPYRLQNLGDVVALVQTGATDIAIGGRDLPHSDRDPSYPPLRQFMGRAFSLIVRFFLVPRIPDTQCGLKAFSAAAAKLLFYESKVDGFGLDFEILYLANKYGFRIERIPVSMAHRHESKVRVFHDSFEMLRDVFRVRWNNRRNLYRSPRRCPVCFSTEVHSHSQIEGFLVRACRRCKCRYLAEFPSDEELEALYDSGYFASDHDLLRGYSSREASGANRRTDEKRLAILRRTVPPRARVLEVGAGNGLFGELAARELDYVGIDLSADAVKEARGRGLEVYRASLYKFVNTGGSFDAITLFHVFEHLADPHDALAKLRELLKPGGIIVLITPDTESLLCAVSGDRWVSYKFPEHLILYSRSALIELLEHSEFEILTIGADHEYHDHDFLLSRLTRLSPITARLSRPILRLLPDPLLVTSGSIRIVARRRAGPPLAVRGIPGVEITHAR